MDSPNDFPSRHGEGRDYSTPVNTTFTPGGFVDYRDAEILLHQYSEWLDVEKINPSTPETVDGRTHDDLVKLFIASRNVYAVPYLEKRSGT